jgi:hypothetical protein
MLSGLSLVDNITTIAIQALPIYSHDLSNSDDYQFGEFDTDPLILDQIPKVEKGPSRKFQTGVTSFRGRLDRVVASIDPRKVTRFVNENPNDTGATPIFVVTVRQSIPYANVAINLTDENGSSYIYMWK